MINAARLQSPDGGILVAASKSALLLVSKPDWYHLRQTLPSGIMRAINGNTNNQFFFADENIRLNFKYRVSLTGIIGDIHWATCAQRNFGQRHWWLGENAAWKFIKPMKVAHDNDIVERAWRAIDKQHCADGPKHQIPQSMTWVIWIYSTSTCLLQARKWCKAACGKFHGAEMPAGMTGRWWYAPFAYQCQQLYSSPLATTNADGARKPIQRDYLG